jgi:hypothetical protein
VVLVLLLVLGAVLAAAYFVSLFFEGLYRLVALLAVLFGAWVPVELVAAKYIRDNKVLECRSRPRHSRTRWTNPSGKGRLWAAVTTAAVHGLLWLPALLWLAVFLPRAVAVLARLGVRPPWLTEVVWADSRPALDWPVACAAAWVAFVAADCWVLWRLDRPAGYGVLRESWSGLLELQFPLAGYGE